MANLLAIETICGVADVKKEDQGSLLAPMIALK